MSFTIDKTIESDFAGAVERTTAALKAEGFGVLSSIDIAATLKSKLGVDLRPYTILGACNPPLAHQALTAEPKIGVMLPCNVVVQQLDSGMIQVSAIDPGIAMQAVDNPGLAKVASEVTDKLRRAVAAI